ncbi:hypothetical protein ACI2LF_08340 [Kribbella sp. NPDC020789]
MTELFVRMEVTRDFAVRTGERAEQEGMTGDQHLQDFLKLNSDQIWSSSEHGDAFVGLHMNNVHVQDNVATGRRLSTAGHNSTDLAHETKQAITAAVNGLA